MPAAKLIDVSKTYQKKIHALEHVSLELDEGRCMALLGPNGAGKTTLVKVLTRLLSVDTGNVEGPPRRAFGVALQEIGLWPHLSIMETLWFVASLYKLSNETAKVQIEHLLHTLELDKIQNRRFDTLSDGLKRRVNLACALVHSPRILVLDEPSAGLDVHARRTLWDYLEKLIAETKMTLLLSTHDLEEAARLGERIAILDHGKLMAVETPDALLSEYGRGDEINLSFSPADALSESALNRLPGYRSGKISNGKARVFIKDGIRHLPAILNAMTQVKIQIEDVSVKPNSLADVFLTLTGHPLD